MKKKPFVIIGSSAAGSAALSTLSNNAPQGSVICITQEKFLPYNTCSLVHVLAQKKTREDISLFTRAHAVNGNTITWYLSTEVTEINPRESTVTTNRGEKMSYGGLLLATGTKPELPAQYSSWVTGAKGIFVFHTLSDTLALDNYISSNGITEAIVVGAGLTGLECADALTKRAILVTIIEQKSTLWPAYLSSVASSWLCQKIEERITVFLNTCLTAFSIKDNRICGVTLANGKELTTQMLVLALGSRPAGELASAAGLALDKGAIVIDSSFRTSEKNIFAAGDCAIMSDKNRGLHERSNTWAQAMKQGVYAAYAMIGQSKKYSPAVAVGSSLVFSIPLAYCGAHYAAGLTAQWYSTEHFCYGLFLDNIKRVRGCVLLGDTKPLNSIKKGIETETPFVDFDFRG